MTSLPAHDKVAILVEALPYIRRFAGQTVVIKYGGAAMAAANLKQAVMQDVAFLKYVGMHPVVVHGGGPEVSGMMQRLGKQAEFVDGLRVTDLETVEIAQMVLHGKTNREIVAALNSQGVPAIGISGQDASLLVAQQHVHRSVKTGELVDVGFVGDIRAINTRLIKDLTAAGYVPVISPIGVGEGGQAYNINADTVAGEVAAALGAAKLVLLTDVEGVRTDAKDPATLVPRLTEREIRHWLKEGKLEGGMIPKVEACLRALEGGVGQVHIIDGRVPHSLLLEVFTDKGVGTMVVR